MKNIEEINKKSLDILNDINLLLQHLNKNDGKYVCFIKTTVMNNENIKIGYLAIENLKLFEVLEVYTSFTNYIKRKIEMETCSYNNCRTAKEKLMKIIERC